MRAGTPRQPPRRASGDARRPGGGTILNDDDNDEQTEEGDEDRQDADGGHKRTREGLRDPSARDGDRRCKVPRTGVG